MWHFIHHLTPQDTAGFILTNGSMTANQSSEGDIRRSLIKTDLVDSMVTHPGEFL